MTLPWRCGALVLWLRMPSPGLLPTSSQKVGAPRAGPQKMAVLVRQIHKEVGVGVLAPNKG